jgi:hypothetical protein
MQELRTPFGSMRLLKPLLEEKRALSHKILYVLSYLGLCVINRQSEERCSHRP